MIDKLKIYDACLLNIEKRIQSIQEALDAAIAAGNEETKSSVGDKYETGRAMMQMEQNKHQAQLDKAMVLKNELLQINLNKKYGIVEKGALVATDAGYYFIATSIGKIIIEENTVYAISLDAPLAKAFIGKKENDVAFFQDKKYTIKKLL